MKKILLFLIMSLISTYSFGQSTFLERNKTIDVNLGYSSLGATAALHRDNIHGVNGMHCSLSGWGAYFDFSVNTEGAYERELGLEKYNGYYVNSWHVGYALPVCDWFKIIPTIGIHTWLKGYYDGSDWFVDDYGIVNRFKDARGDYRRFDCGASFQFTLFKYLNLYVNVTSYNIGGGIGLCLSKHAFNSAYY